MMRTFLIGVILLPALGVFGIPTVLFWPGGGFRYSECFKASSPDGIDPPR